MNPERDMSEADLKLRMRLREAVLSEETPPFLEARIRAQIQAAAAATAADRPNSFRLRGWVLATAALALLAAVGISYELGHLRYTQGSQDSYITAMGNRVATIMRVGLSDHLHCAYFRKFPQTPPKTEEFVSKMGPEYAGLIPIVQKHVPERYRLELAHRCRFRGRQFVHLILKDDSQLISLVVARKADGESFSIEGVLPSLVQSGLPVYRAAARKFEIAGFESRDHLVYLVSDLPGQDNLNQLLAMTPAVREFLGNLERL